jgi:hypothetical protein
MGFKIVEDRPTPKQVYNWRIYFIAVMTSFGSALFGYDTGYHTQEINGLTIQLHWRYNRPHGLQKRLWFHGKGHQYTELLFSQRRIMFSRRMFLRSIHDISSH